jgi:hypothetical protein
MGATLKVQPDVTLQELCERVEAEMGAKFSVSMMLLEMT